MIERYTLPEMGQLWSERYKFQTWLQVELAVCRAQAELGYIPAEAAETIEARADFDPARIAEIEGEVRHDVIAFLTNVGEHVGDASRYIHLGLTSSDVLDTGLALQLSASLERLLEQVEALAQAIRYKAQQHRYTVMVGRSHGIHAEPITFGFKLAGWLAEVCRHRDRLVRLRPEIAVGKISGAVGTYAHLDPQVEARACQQLNLTPDVASTQVVSRDRHAAFVEALALLGASIERFAVEIRNLQRTDVLEVEEFFATGQKGSSAMPHKRNPIRSERLTGLARVLRGHATAALENVPLWHERDISHSSVERIALPESCIYLHFMLNEMAELVKGLLVYPQNMQRNLNAYGGAIFSQQVLLKLVEKGMSREAAYDAVQACAHQAWNHPQGDFRAAIGRDERITSQLSAEEIEACFDPQQHLKHLEAIYQRLGI
ncbi:MAG: adenylosuccinate lyase [Cyanobacteria bacterium QS_8_64_29]|nr:MAG: adenylosuccinate lyase [Cyanobacteria bacterium QS_8_64_29]